MSSVFLTGGLEQVKSSPAPAHRSGLNSTPLASPMSVAGDHRVDGGAMQRSRQEIRPGAEQAGPQAWRLADLVQYRVHHAKRSRAGRSR